MSIQGSFNDDAAFAARAAWLHFAGGKTQGEVAEMLGVQSTKAHRLIARARNEGLIRVYIEGPIAGCIELEGRLKNSFGLTTCEVVPNLDDGDLPLRTLGMAGARYLQNLIEGEAYGLIGVGHGRTLAAAADLIASAQAQAVKFVSLLGGLTRRFAASPFDVIHRLAERTSAEAYVMPVPFFANSVKDKLILEAQAGVAEALELVRNADIYIAGIGTLNSSSFLATGGMAEATEIEAVLKSGASGELLGHFYDVKGNLIASALSDRAMAPRLADLKSHKIVALAGGTSKTQAIRAILSSGLLYGLITDEATARRLVTTRTG